MQDENSNLPIVSINACYDEQIDAHEKVSKSEIDNEKRVHLVGCLVLETPGDDKEIAH